MGESEARSARSTAKMGAKSTVKTKAAAKTKMVPLDFYAPEANTVAVAGDFNSWDVQAHMLKQSKAGWWKISLKLEPGRYGYRFVINGEQWNEDPENPNKEPNEFHSYNSVLEVR